MMSRSLQSLCARTALPLALALRLLSPDGLAALQQAGINDFYMQYFQAEGVAEAEFEQDVAATLRAELNRALGDGDLSSGFVLTLERGREAEFLARVSHPHVAQLLDAGVTADNLEDTLDIWRQLVEIFEREIIGAR